MTGWNGIRAWPFNAQDDSTMLSLWRQGHNTLVIAQEMTVPESAIANRLPHVLERARQDDDWERDDLSKSIDECYRTIKQRAANGGPGWGGWPPESTK